MTTLIGQPAPGTPGTPGTPGNLDPAAQRKATRRRDLRLVTLAWVFGAVWMAIAMGTVMQEFLRTLGTPEWAFGMIGAIPMVCGLSQLPAGLIVDRYGCRKKLFMLTLTTSRAMFIVIGLIPWLMPGMTEWWWRLAFGTVTVAWLLGQAGGPAWTQWMSDVIPRRVRGRYFAFRNQIGHVIGVATALTAGYLLDRFGGEAGVADDRLRLVAALLLIVAGVLGVLDIQCFRPIHDHPPHRDPASRLRPRIAQALRQKKLWLFLSYSFTLQLACGGMGGYLYLFLREHIGLTMTMLNVCQTLIPVGVTLFGLRFWGRIIDRVGPERVLAACSLLVVMGPLGWLLTTPDLFWPGYSLMLIGPFTWAGLGQASFQVTMSMSSANEQAGKRRSAASSGGGGAINVALVSIAGAAGAVLSGVWMGAVADSFVGFHYEPAALGIEWTYHALIFVGSMSIRIIAVLLAMAMVVKTAPRLRDVVRPKRAVALG